MFSETKSTGNPAKSLAATKRKTWFFNYPINDNIDNKREREREIVWLTFDSSQG